MANGEWCDHIRRSFFLFPIRHSLFAIRPLSRRSVADRRLERQRGIPGKEDPGILRDFRDERIDQRASHRLGVDGGEMRLGQDVAHQLGGLPGVDQVVHHQKTFAAAGAERHHGFGHGLEQLELTLADMIVAAVALENDLTLLTDNRKDFPILGLKFYTLR